MHAILSVDPPEIQSTTPGTAQLAGIARRCLEKNPAERFQSARDVAFALDAISSNVPVQPGVTRRSRRPLWAGIAVLLVIAASAVVLIPRILRGRATATAGHKRIVVLPFEDLGPASDFASGLAEELSSRLAVLHGLDVISRNSADRYAKSGKSTKDIGAELRVDYIMSGTVRWERSGDSKGSSPCHSAARSRCRRHDRLVRPVRSRCRRNLQRPIRDRGKVAGEMNLTLVSAERQRIEAQPTSNMEAYQAYLQGVHLDAGADRISGSVSRRVAESFERAVALDPSFALAHARLSEAYSNRYRFGRDRSPERIARARAEVDRALALQPNLARAHMALGIYHYSRSEYDEALRELEIAARDLPGDPDVPFWIASVYRRQGRWEESAVEEKRALELDPQSRELPRDIGDTFAMLRQYSEALVYFDRAIAAAPNQIGAYNDKALTQIAATGDVRAARTTLGADARHGRSGFRQVWLRQELSERRFREALARIFSMRFEVFAGTSTWEPRALTAADLYTLLEDRAHAQA
jgi:tetratricopeptide (TPR) repeat protein